MFKLNLKKNFFLLLLTFQTLFVFSFLSCAVSDPGISSASGTLVLDFSDEKNPAESRLAVFLQLSSEIQRADSFTVKNEETGYVWTVASPACADLGSKKYVFAGNLRSPQGENIPGGTYEIVYDDAAGNSARSTLKLEYKTDFLTADSKKALELLGSKSENVAIYDEQEELLYFGKKKLAWSSNALILKEYRLGYKMRVCYTNPSNTIMCLMPAELLKKED